MQCFAIQRCSEDWVTSLAFPRVRIDDEGGPLIAPSTCWGRTRYFTVDRPGLEVDPGFGVRIVVTSTEWMVARWRNDAVNPGGNFDDV
jgi:hypothetical protein